MVWLYNYIFKSWETKVRFSHLEGWDNPNQTGNLQWSASLPERWMSTQPGNYWQISGKKKKSTERLACSPSFEIHLLRKLLWPRDASCSWRKPYFSSSSSGRELLRSEIADEVKPECCAVSGRTGSTIERVDSLCFNGRRSIKFGDNMSK